MNIPKWNHCNLCKSAIVGWWALFFALLTFIGWGCSSDQTTAGDGSAFDSVAGHDGRKPDESVDGVVALDSKTDHSTVQDDAGQHPDKGQPVDTSTTGQDAGLAGNDGGRDDPGGDGGVATEDSGSEKPGTGDAGTDTGFKPGVDQCGHEATTSYVACCPAGVDCGSAYGVRRYCDCGVQPSQASTKTVCQGYVGAGPRTVFPTRCVAP